MAVVLVLVSVCLSGLVQGGCRAPGPPAPVLLTGDVAAEPSLRAACEVTEKRCVRCHTIDRVVYATSPTPHVWEQRVDRMRRMRGSGITHAERNQIVTCLVYRSFGPGGLAQLRARPEGGQP